MFEYFVEQKEQIKTKKVFIHVREIPASEEDPFQLFLRVDKDGLKKDELFFKDTTGEAVKRLVLEIPTPKIARALVIELKLSIAEVGINSVQSFNVTDDGEHILFAATEAGLKILQKKDDKFEGSVPAVEETKTEAPSTTTTTTKPATEKQYTMDDLVRLNELVQKGILSQEEFAKIKKRVLGL
jgi:hypothetical protein